MKTPPIQKFLGSYAAFERQYLNMRLGFIPRIAILLTSLAIMSWKSSLEAQTVRTWSGAGADANWGTAANWGGTAPVGGNTLTFAGTVQPSTNNNLAADTSFAAINFTNTVASQAFTLGGNRITLGGSIVLTAAAGSINDTIGLDILLSGTRTIQTATNHSLTISGLVSDGGGAFGLSKQGGSGTILTLSNASNSFTGAVTLTSGTISFATIADLGSASALGAGGTIITASSAGSTGTLSYTGGGNSTNRQIQIAAGGTLTSTIGLIIENVGTGALVFSNSAFNVAAPTYTGAKTLTLQGTNTANNTISGAIVNNSTTGTIAVTKSNSGVWALGGTNTYTGGTNVNTGVLTFLNTNAKPATGTTAVAAGATLGLGVATSGSFFTSTDVDNLLAGTFTGNLTNVTHTPTSNVGIDTTAGDFTYASSIPVTTRGLAKVGSNALTLTGANGHSGGTLLIAGTLNVNNVSALGSGTLTVTGGTIDNTTAGALTLSTNNPVAYNGTFAFGGTQDLNLGSGIVTIGGSSRTLTLNGNKTLTMGQLQWNSTSDRTLTVTQGTGSGGKLSIGGFQLSPTATSTINRTITGTGNVEITGAIVNGGSFPINLAYSGSAILTLSAANSYTGITTAAGGLIMLNNAMALPGGVASTGGTSALLIDGTSTNGGVIGLTAATGDFTRSIVGLTPGATQVGWASGGWGGFAAFGGDRTVNFGGAVTPTSFTWSSSGGVFGGGLVLSDTTSDSTVTVVNPINLNNALGSRTVSVNNGTPAVDAILSGILSGSTTRLIKTGAGTLALTATNSYSSSSVAGTVGTTITAGTLQVGNGGTAGSISAGGDIDNNAVLSFNRSNGLTVTNNVIGAGVLNQIGSGMTTLSGTNTYGGGTNVNTGGLTFLNTNARPLTGTTTVAAGATLGLGVATAGSFFTSTDVDSLFVGALTNVTNSATSNVGIDTTAGNFTYATSVASTTRGLTKLGSNTLSLSGANSYTGTTTLSGGILRLDNANALPGGVAPTGGTSNLTMNGGILGLTAASGDFTRGIGSGVSQIRWITDTVNGFAAFGGDRNVNFGGSVTPSTVSWSNSLGVLGNGLILSDSSSDSTITILNPIALNFTNSFRTITVNDGSSAVDAVLAGVLSSATTSANGTRLIKNGNGTLALTAANTYVSGSTNPGTTISAGTLQLGNGGTTGSISALSGVNITSDVSISSGATFAFNRSDTGLVVANTIFGAGAVSQRGTGSTTLTGANTYSGGTNVTNGTLLINNTTGSGTGTGAVTTSSSTILGGTGTLSPGSSNGISVGGSLAPGDPAVNSGVGTLTFSPVNGDAAFTSTSTLDFQLLTQGLHGYAATYNLDGTLSTLTGSYVGGGNDRLIFNGSAAANKLDFSNLGTSNFNVTFGSGYTPAANDLFDLLDWANLTGSGGLNNESSAIAGLTLVQLDLPTLSGGLLWDTSFWTSHGVIGITVVPEPSRGLLLLLGVLSLVLRRRK